MKWASSICLRLNETVFAWVPKVKLFRSSQGNHSGYANWLWFCLNWSAYKRGLVHSAARKDH